MDIKPIWCVFVLIAVDLIIFIIASFLDMRETPPQRIFMIILVAVINVFISTLWK